MAAELSELKNQVANLVADLEAISRESASFQETNDTLNGLAASMADTSDELRKVIEESEKVYSLVNELAVKKTLESFNASAEAFTAKAEALTTKIGKHQTLFTTDVKTSVDGLAKQLKADYATLNAAVNKKVMLLGGISVACSIVALVLSFIK